MDYVDSLLNDENVDVSEWSNRLFKKQEAIVYDSLTAVRDFNHVVKSEAQKIMDRLRLQNDSESAEKRLQEALSLLLNYLKSNRTWKPASDQPPLTMAETAEAFKDLCVSRYSKIDRKFDDPAVRNQSFGLYSFKPTIGAKPDADGNYGVLRLRGNYASEDEAQEKAKELIQYNSANKIFVVEVGRPAFVKEKLLQTRDVIEVDESDNGDANDDTVKYLDLIKEDSLKHKKQMEEIRLREKELIADVSKSPEDRDPLDTYIELNKKRGTLAFHYKSFSAKVDEIKASIIKVRQQIADMDSDHPNFKHEYVAYYEKQLEASGVKVSTDAMAMQIKESFNADPDLGF